jgi:hypothetical protein
MQSASMARPGVYAEGFGPRGVNSMPVIDEGIGSSVVIAQLLYSFTFVFVGMPITSWGQKHVYFPSLESERLSPAQWKSRIKRRIVCHQECQELPPAGRHVSLTAGTNGQSSKETK